MGSSDKKKLSKLSKKDLEEKAKMLGLKVTNKTSKEELLQLIVEKKDLKSTSKENLKKMIAKKIAEPVSFGDINQEAKRLPPKNYSPASNNIISDYSDEKYFSEGYVAYRYSYLEK